MGIKRALAKVAPKAISDKAIDKGEHNGDDWAMVSAITQSMCEGRFDGKRMNFVYKDKTVGWAKQDGTSWFDDDAYDRVKKDFEALPEERKAEINDMANTIRSMQANGAPSHPRQVREAQARAKAVEAEFGAIEDNGEEYLGIEGGDE